MIEILSVGKIGGRVDAPSCKSISQRALLLAAFLPGQKRIGPVNGCDDENVALAICQNTGMHVVKDGLFYNIYGDPKQPLILSVGESGTSFRLVLGLLAAKKWKCRLQWEGRVSERPMGSLLQVLRDIGCAIAMDGDDILFDGTHARTMDFISVDGSESSQFVSSIMLYMALNPHRHKKVRVTGKKISAEYIEITASLLKDMGVDVRIQDNLIEISGTLTKMDATVNIEGDYSGSAFLMAAGILLSDDGILIGNLKRESIQPDRNILNILNGYLEWNEGALLCRKRNIKNTLVVDVDINPDLAPVIALLGMFSPGGCVIRNSGRLTGKESDRRRAIIDIAEAIGSIVTLEDETIRIKPGKLSGTPVVPMGKDHRIVMEIILVLSKISEKFIVSGVEYLSKSFPDFIETLIAIGFDRVRE